MAKTVLVTGASSGIGKATAIHLAQHGYQVYGVARRLEKMEDLKSYEVKTLQLDITNDDSISRCVNHILTEATSIDILINCAGLGSYGALEDVPIADAKNQLEINLFGGARLIQLVLPGMRKNNYGKIVNISSVGGKAGLPMGTWYHASKFAIEGLSDSLRNEVKGFGIDVIVIQPGATKSEMIGSGAAELNRYSGGTAYKKLTQGIANAYTTMEKNSIEAVEIAKIIRKGIEAKCPKTRYAAKNAKPILLMRKLLSDNLFDKMLMSQLK